MNTDLIRLLICFAGACAAGWFVPDTYQYIGVDRGTNVSLSLSIMSGVLLGLAAMAVYFWWDARSWK